MLCENIGRNPEGVLTFAGQDTAALAARYGTPLYLMDEDCIRQNCRTYLSAAKAFPNGGHIAYASKAASFVRLYQIMKEEGMWVDVVSCGEIFTAKKAGFPLSNAFFHSNNKTDADIAYAMDAGIGCFVADGEDELRAIEAEAAKRGTVQKILLRLTPGIDPHTFAAVSTGQVDSKFGTAIETGQAEQTVRLALSLPHISLEGFHCHVGSQVTEPDIFLRAAHVMLTFMARMRKELGYTASLLDLGGGWGVPYKEGQPRPDIEAGVSRVGSYVKEVCDGLSFPCPVLCMEPGRSIVADAGMTLYTVGSVKHIPGYRTYVSVDGGMTDNPRFALYGAPYTLLPVHGTACDMTADVVGRCCESGDILQRDVPLPSGMKRGDLLACLTTGAYNYSMASNYNRIPRPPVVMLRGGTSFLAVRRETWEDEAALDLC